jgi:hypothetical protein
MELLKYGSEEKGSSLYKCSILLYCQKTRFVILSSDKSSEHNLSSFFDIKKTREDRAFTEWRTLLLRSVFYRVSHIETQDSKWLWGVEGSIFYWIWVPSGFRRFGLLCFINQVSKNDIGWPQQPRTRKVLKFNMIYYYSTVKNFFFETLK